LLVVALLGLGIEIGQTFVPGRTGSAFDFAADVAGVAMAATLGSAVRRRSFPGIPRRAR
jgi:VanZ family protein